MKTRIPLSALFLLACMSLSLEAAAQASQNENSAYAHCHEANPPPECEALCGPDDTWCEFAGFSCYLDNPNFDCGSDPNNPDFCVPNVKNHTRNMEQIGYVYRDFDGDGNVDDDDVLASLSTLDPSYWEDPAWDNLFYASDADEMKAMVYTRHLAIKNCYDNGPGDLFICMIAVTYDSAPNCDWQDWHCDHYYNPEPIPGDPGEPDYDAPAQCLLRGI